jgi:hypothetical protein
VLFRSHENTQQIIYTNVGVILYNRSTRYRGKLRNDGTKGINYRHTQLEYTTYFLLATYFDSNMKFIKCCAQLY